MNFQDVFLENYKESSFKESSPIMLAFIGDAVHTLFVRDKVVKSGNLLIKDYHKKSSFECRAKNQAEFLDKIMLMLNVDELDILRRARNAKIGHIAKNSDIETYKKATAFEALVGYLYLKGDFDRLNQILNV